MRSSEVLPDLIIASPPPLARMVRFEADFRYSLRYLRVTNGPNATAAGNSQLAPSPCLPLGPSRAIAEFLVPIAYHRYSDYVLIGSLPYGLGVM
jgi:hypothetical protein